MHSGHGSTAKMLIVFIVFIASLNHACDKGRDSYPPSRLPVVEKAKITPTGTGTFTDVLTGMQFVLIRGGCYRMGDAFGDGDSDEQPVHKVCVNSYYMGKYEVTQGQWEKVRGNNPSDFRKGHDYPVEQVSWYDAQDYIAELNRLTGKTFRLPTEAEWEYAARESGKYEKYSGFTDEREMLRYANFCDINCQENWKPEMQKDKYKNTSPVGRHKPNRQGLYDLTGNVWEWVQDWYDQDYYKDSPKNNPQGPIQGRFKVIRGGAWDSAPKDMRAANRDSLEPKKKSNNIGFRLVLPAK